jgi:fibronectin-binding autotransporter adhesin
MKLKRLISFGSALVLSFSSLLFINLGHAFAATITWSGTAGDGKLATAGNWVGGVAPVTGDSLTFPKNAGTSDITLTNDLSTSVCINGITTQANDSGKYSGYVIGGAALNAQGTYTEGTYNQLNVINLTLCGDLTLATNSYLTAGLYNNAGSLSMGTHNIVATASGSNVNVWSVITGSGNFTGGTNVSITFETDSPAYSGSVTTDGNVQLYSAQAAGSGALNFSSNGSLYICSTTSPITITNDITIGGTNRIISECTSGTLQDVTLTGTLTLTANTTVYVNDTSAKLIVSGPLHGNFTLTPEPGMLGTLVISSSDNTSLTPNGSAEAPVQTTTVAAGDDQPSLYVNVYKNQTYIIDGVRGNTYVGSGGILKGTGTVGTLQVFGGTVAPGHSPGCLNSNALTLSGAYQAELGGTTACSGYDQLNVAGTVTLNDGGTPPTSGTLAVSLYGKFKPAKGNVFTIINNDGSDAVVGTFANLAEGATFKVDGNVLKISYKGGDGNDVTLTVLSVKAPDTGIAMIATHPAETVAITSLMAAGIYLISRKQKAFLKK